ncbi:MAG: peptidylprolyl isomerase [Chlorobiaceae bacterium]|nr:peptidylprolyl isomerase [Chlorobiaceae bacterium]MBA4309854.1 peptidylprolyl isomerase [Chlorobiaceae bacterium]
MFLFTFFIFLGCGDAKNQDSTKIERSTMEKLLYENDSVTVAVVKTNMGTIEIGLYDKLTPKTVENFVGLAKKNYYNGIIFHRVIANFMVQGGDPTGTGRGGESLWGGKFNDEIHKDLVHEPGVLSMANAGPNTNGSQFFLTLVPCPWLDGKHTVFGKVIAGLDTLQAIGNVKVGPMDKPVEKVEMQSVTIEVRPSPKD